MTGPTRQGKGTAILNDHEHRKRAVEQDLRTTLKDLLLSLEPSSGGITARAVYEPESRFGASVSASPDGPCIKVYDGLLNVSAVATSLLVARIELRHHGEILRPECSLEDAHSDYNAMIDSVVNHGIEYPSIQLSEARRAHASALHGFIVEFALAHELAHIANGDLSNDGSQGETSGLGDWERECRADARAIELLRPRYTRQPLYATYVGAVVFFEVVDSIRRRTGGSSKNGSSELTSHPTARSRRAEIFRRTLPARLEMVRSGESGAAEMHVRLGQYVSYLQEVAYAIPFEGPAPEEDYRHLHAWARECDHAWFMNANPSGEALNPITTESLRQAMDRGRDYLASLISTLAVAHLTIGDYSSGYAAFALGILIELYLETHCEDRERDELLLLLQRCIPNVQHIVDDNHQSIALSLAIRSCSETTAGLNGSGE